MGKKQTIAFDFDGVLYPYLPPFSYNLPCKPIPGAVEFFNQVQENGYIATIFSCRARDATARCSMINWLVRHGFNIAEVIISDRKPHALLYIDDRGFRFEGTFPSLDQIKHFRPWIKDNKHLAYG